MKAKKIYPFIIGTLVIGAVIWMLLSNKTTMDEKAERSLVGNTEIPVNVSSPEYISVGHDIEITGNIASKNEVLIMPKSQGIVLAKYKKAGEYVTQGTTIAKIEDDVIRENLRVSELNLAKARKDLERYRSLLKADAVTKTEVEQVEIAMRSAESLVVDLKEQLKNTLITAPVTGILEKDYFEVGSLVAPGMLMGEIIDPRNLKVDVTVTGKELVRLKKGESVIVTVDVFPDKVFEGRIDLIGSKGDESMTYTMEVVFKADYSDMLKPGMHAQVKAKIPVQDAEKMLTIERRCIIGSLKNPSVYIVHDGKAYRQEITTGKVINDRIEVLDGLSAENIIVSNGQINLKDSCAVTIIK